MLSQQRHAIILFTLLASSISLAQTKNNKATTKGLLPEIQLDQNNESANEKKAIQSEILISQTEEKARVALEKIILAKKGTLEEPDLWYRLAELHMRKSKSGRFFDLYQESAALKNTTFPLQTTKGKDSIRKAVEIYNRIEKQFPKYKEMDSVLFNNAFAHQQLNLPNAALELYQKMLKNFPSSTLKPDALLATGELYYDQKNFQKALENFNLLESFSESKVYFYGLYKAAWSEYNLKHTNKGINKLVQVVQLTPVMSDGSPLQKHKHNLRKEALRDLVVFIGEEIPADEVYTFFAKICTDDELAQAMIDLSQLYISHSRLKAVPLFLNQYIEKNIKGSGLVRSHLFIAEVQESLKNRDDVLKELIAVEKLCATGSLWRLEQKAEIVKDSCEDKYQNYRQDLLAKWWDIWQKNKNHKEFSNWMQQLLELALREEITQPSDHKNRYAYAELLFQSQQYLKASQEYEMVYQTVKTEPLRHDVLYSALFSMENHIDKDVKNIYRRNVLAETYIKEYPAGKYANEVNYQLALFHYEKKLYEDALKKLVLISEKNPLIKNKADDLVLDIYNIQKNYKEIVNKTDSLLKLESNPERRLLLTKILQQAELAIAQKNISDGQTELGSEQLILFSKKYPDAELAKDAQWQAVGLLFAQKKLYQAAEQTLLFADKYAKNKTATDKSFEAYNEAAKAYVMLGQLIQAAQIYQKILDNSDFFKKLDKETRTKKMELMADFYWLEGKNNQAQILYKKLLDQNYNKDIYQKFVKTFDRKNLKDWEILQKDILHKNIEPLATEILTEKAVKLFLDKKMNESFEMARKILNRNSSSEARAPARLLQADILAEELIKQSMKAKPDRINIVLGIKTEKLDKAQTAYLSVLKMTSESDLQIKALQGLEKIYQNYINSLENFPFNEDYSKEDITLVQSEFAKITDIFYVKLKENQDQIQKINLNSKAQNKMRSYASNSTNSDIPISEKETYLPQLQMPQPKILNHVWLDKKMEQMAVKKQYFEIEQESFALMNNEKDFLKGIYYQILLADIKGLSNKALWLIEQNYKNYQSKGNEDLFFLIEYQKAKILYQEKPMEKDSTVFSKWINIESRSFKNLTEYSIFKGLHYYQQKDFKKSSEYFSTVKKEMIYNYEIDILVSESWAQSGQYDQALAMVEVSLKNKVTHEVLLQQARIYESFKKDLKNAIKSYEQASRLTQNEGLKFWIQKKIDYLKSESKKEGIKS